MKTLCQKETRKVLGRVQWLDYNVSFSTVKHQKIPFFSRSLPRANVGQNFVRFDAYHNVMRIYLKQKRSNDKVLLVGSMMKK